MPNWCHNELRISGPSKEIKLFIEKMEYNLNHAEKSLKEEILIPTIPKELDDRVFDRLADTQIDDMWKVRNWGSRSGFGIIFSVQHKCNSAVYIFETAWSPPIPLVLELRKVFPNLNFAFRFSEPGNNLEGKIKIKKGELYEEEFWLKEEKERLLIWEEQTKLWEQK